MFKITKSLKENNEWDDALIINKLTKVFETKEKAEKVFQECRAREPTSANEKYITLYRCYGESKANQQQ